MGTNSSSSLKEFENRLVIVKQYDEPGITLQQDKIWRVEYLVKKSMPLSDC